MEVLWILCQTMLVDCWLPGSRHRCWLLRLFGARIGQRVIMKPRVRIKFPWKLEIGDHAWIGEEVWIDNLAEVSIGPHSVISQGAYICTGSHDWTTEAFDLITKPVAIADQCWVAAFARLSPGVQMQQGSVLALGSVASGVLEAWTIYRGNPAAPLRHRPTDPCGHSSWFPPVPMHRP